MKSWPESASERSPGSDEDGCLALASCCLRPHFPLRGGRSGGTRGSASHTGSASVGFQGYRDLKFLDLFFFNSVAWGCTSRQWNPPFPSPRAGHMPRRSRRRLLATPTVPDAGPRGLLLSFGLGGGSAYLPTKARRGRASTSTSGWDNGSRIASSSHGLSPWTRAVTRRDADFASGRSPFAADGLDRRPRGKRAHLNAGVGPWAGLDYTNGYCAATPPPPGSPSREVCPTTLASHLGSRSAPSSRQLAPEIPNRRASRATLPARTGSV